MSKTRIIALLGIAILLGAVFTNPSKDEINAKLNQQAKVILKKQVGSEHAELVDLGMTLFGDRIAREFLENYTYTKNYYLYSQCKMHWNGEEITLATAVFNQVYLHPDLEEHLAPVLNALKDQ